MTARAANQSFSSTFTGSFDGWVQNTGTFSTANNYLINTTPAIQCIMRRDTANGDFQMKFSYRDTSPISGPWGQLRFRYVDDNNFGYLTLYPGSFSLSEKRAGTLVTLASGSWSTTSGDWYDVTLIADGSHIEVWRGPKDGAQTRMCSVDTATVLSGNASYLVVTTDGVYAFDDVQVSAEDLSATTYTYDAANQLTAMNVNGTTTNFTYDAWGRMVGKTQGAYAATYYYRFGDKLKSVTSNFPGETASVGYNYDGLGRRRLEQRDNTTATWFRWSGSEECGEYAGTVGSWTIGALQTGYVPGLATFAGSNPSTAEWRYHLTDHLGSVRQLTGQTKAALARYDYAPYGELLRSAGQPLTVGYTGHLWDSAIDQYYAPFRYYNPQTARWNMRDPLGFVDGPNVYAYVSNAPIRRSDLLGLCGKAPNGNGLHTINAVTRPVDEWWARLLYTKYVSLGYHSYFEFPDGEKFWLHPEGGFRPEVEKTGKLPYHRWPLKQKTDGTLPNGTPCSLASQDAIKQCLKDTPASGKYRIPDRTCNSQNKKGRKRCCLSI